MESSILLLIDNSENMYRDASDLASAIDDSLLIASILF